MALLNDVKPRLGVFYSETTKDTEIQGMIDGATQYFKAAGWDFTALLASLTEIEAELAEDQDALETLEAVEEPTAEQVAQIAALEIAIAENTAALAEINIQLAVPKEGIILYCKMAQSTDPAQLTNHPVLIAFVAQGRAVVPDAEV